MFCMLLDLIFLHFLTEIWISIILEFYKQMLSEFDTPQAESPPNKSIRTPLKFENFFPESNFIQVSLKLHSKWLKQTRQRINQHFFR